MTEGRSMQEALRTYLELALGVTEGSRTMVRNVVRDLVGRGNATAEQVKSLTSELLAANSTNREALAKLVRYEVDRALGAVGLATADEVTELTARVRELERRLRTVESAPVEGAGRPTKAAPGKATRAAPAKRSAPMAAPVAPKVAAKKVAKKATRTAMRSQP